MARARKDSDAVEVVSSTSTEPDEPAQDQVSNVAAEGGTNTVADDNENRSSETIVILPAEDEPVRRGGHILTDQGWVPEDLVPEDN